MDGRAYSPLAFEIAARGHLVVIVQQPMRDASVTFEDANAVLDSDNPLFSLATGRINLQSFLLPSDRTLR